MDSRIGPGLSLALIALLLILLLGCQSSSVADGLNFAPEFHSATYNAATRVLAVNASDRDGDDLTVSVTVPAALAVDQAQQVVDGGSGSAHFTWSAVDAAAGASGTVVVSVTDNKIAAPVTRDVAVTISPVNVPPVIDSVVFIWPTLTVTVNDANGDDLTVSIELPPGFIADASSKVVTGGSGTLTFTLAGMGAYGDATISASDGIAPLVTATCTVYTFGPGPPVIVDTVWQDKGDGSGALAVNVTSYPLWDLAVSVTTPAGTTVDAEQQVFSGVDDVHAVFTFTETSPGSGASGEVVVTADNGIDPPITQNVQITIAPNHPPVIDNAVFVMPNLTVNVSDPDGDELTVAVTEPAGWAVDSKSKVVTGGNGNAVFNWISAPGSSGVTTISVTDGRIAQPVTTTSALSFEWIQPPPAITAITYDQGILTVSVAEIDSFDVHVSVTVPAGLAVDHTVQTVTGGNGDAVFVWSAVDPSAGGSGTTTVSVTSDAVSTPVTRDVQIMIAPQ